ncbi:hypothetical protein V0288_23155 [Pannus brasiliensis CCIBt3594]|uniref:Winged helix-turn-helix transcriptional regulator n=1 Tax=Pannus brasiliensis CCIBt3594 TaxID=1427578 RepID=A0AAW9R126_9CHRO
MEFNRNYYPSHRKGEETRAEILAAIAQNTHLSIPEISTKVNRCTRQVRRHLDRLRWENKIEAVGKRYTLATLPAENQMEKA